MTALAQLLNGEDKREDAIQQYIDNKENRVAVNKSDYIESCQNSRYSGAAGRKHIDLLEKGAGLSATFGSDPFIPKGKDMPRLAGRDISYTTLL